MSRFKKASDVSASAQAFIDGTSSDNVPSQPVAPQQSVYQSEPVSHVPMVDWRLYDPKATAKNQFPIRLNDYYKTILDVMSEETGQSKHRLMMNAVLPYLDELARRKR